MLERWTAAAWTSGAGAVRCKGAVGDGESDGRSGGVGAELVKARRPVEVMEPRRADRGGGDVRSGGGAEAADAANPLWAAVRWSGLDWELASKIAVWLRVRHVDRGASSWPVGCEGRLRGDRVRAGRAVIYVGGIGAR